MRSARFVPAARREFLAEIVYYNQEQPGLGARFNAAVEEAAARALAFPHAGSPAAGNTRRVLVQGFPFSVVYRDEASGIVIHRNQVSVKPAAGHTAAFAECRSGFVISDWKPCRLTMRSR